jgi:biotin synthase
MSKYNAEVRHGWLPSKVLEVFALSFKVWLFHAHLVHRLYFNSREVHISTLPGIRSGACPGGCKS